MNNKNLYLLLDIVKKNGNVKRLIHEKLDFREIADLTNYAIANDLIFFNEETLVVSDKGNLLYNELEEKYKERDKDKKTAGVYRFSLNRTARHRYCLSC